MITRAVAYIHHFTKAFGYLDWETLIRLFIFRRKAPAGISFKAKLKHASGFFEYRGFADRGVMTHFYEPGYHVFKTTEGGHVEWIVDLGANIGDETVKFAMRHPSAKIIAVEPEPGNFSLLVNNAKPYGDRVNPVCAGIWHRDARLSIIAGSSPEAFSVVESPDGAIKARSMVSLIKEFKIGRIDILKIDIEGAEFVLFENGSEDWLTMVDSIIIELSDVEKAGSFQNFFRALERAGFGANCYISGENIVVIRNGCGLGYVQKIGTTI
jgi:FkbM family methyltransferase